MATLPPILFANALLGHSLFHNSASTIEKSYAHVYSGYNIDQNNQNVWLQPGTWTNAFAETKEPYPSLFALWEQMQQDQDESITMDVVNRVLSEPPSPAKEKRNFEISAPPQTATPEEVSQLREVFEKHSKLGYSRTKEWIESTIISGVFEHSGATRLLPLQAQAGIAASLAELAKKENKLRASRIWSRSCLLLWPGEGKFWSLASKLEEELGNLELAQKLLEVGVRHCCNIGRAGEAEVLALRFLRLIPRTENNGQLIVVARKLIGMVIQNFTHAKVYHHPQVTWWSSCSSGNSSDSGDEHDTESVQKGDLHSHRLPLSLLLEGCLMEYRHHRPDLALGVLGYLLNQMQSRVQVYCTLVDILTKERRWKEAAEVLQNGLHVVPNAGLLYFEALKLQTIMAAQTKKPDFSLRITQIEVTAAKHLAPELLWKFFLNLALSRNSQGDYGQSRKALSQAARHAPQNLLWRVFATGARIEVQRGDIQKARKIAALSLRLVPKKLSSQVLLDISRIEEVAGNVQKAAYILGKARSSFPGEWKLHLESVLQLMRTHLFSEARDVARAALTQFHGTGRLWSVLIQLEYLMLRFESRADWARLLNLCFEGLQHVPKSGELWCETARVFISLGLYRKARQALEFSLTFTPQYGDSLVELLRLELLEHTKPNDEILAVLIDRAKTCSYEPNYGQTYLWCRACNADVSTSSVLSTAARKMATLSEAGLDLSAYIAKSDFHQMPLSQRTQMLFD